MKVGQKLQPLLEGKNSSICLIRNVTAAKIDEAVSLASGRFQSKERKASVNNLGTQQVLHQQLESFQGTRQRQAPSRKSKGQATAPSIWQRVPGPGASSALPPQAARAPDHRPQACNRVKAEYAWLGQGRLTLRDQAAKAGTSLRRMTVTCLLSLSAQIISQVSGELTH